MAPPKRIATVTYIPIHDDDRPTMKWNGITFRANVPVELDRKNPAHWAVQLVRKTVTHPANGGTAYSYADERVFMGESAKGNPSFDVDGFRPKYIAPTTKVPPAGAEWAGTNRDDLVPAEEINYPTDIPAGADHVVIE